MQDEHAHHKMNIQDTKRKMINKHKTKVITKNETIKNKNTIKLNL